MGTLPTEDERKRDSDNKKVCFQSSLIPRSTKLFSMIFWLFKRCEEITDVLHEDTGTGSDKAGDSEDDAKELECDSGGMQSEPKSGFKFNIFEVTLEIYINPFLKS